MSSREQMRKIWTLGAAGVAISAVLAGGGCYDFDAAQKRCREEGRCEQSVPEDAGCVPSSSSEDLPDDEFKDSDCDGIDGRASAGFFVDPVNGDDSTGTGTREAPLRSLSAALTRLRQWDGGSAPARIFLASGTYAEGHVELDVPVSLHGGYAGADAGWRRAGTQLALVDSREPTGFTVRVPTDSGVVLEYLHVRSADAVVNGQPSIAMRVIDSSNVRLRHTILEAGRGGTGKEGSTGSPGIPGGAGQTTPFVQPEIPVAGGVGGTRICPLGDGNAGGTGASGVTHRGGNDGGVGQPIPPLGSISGGNGGRGGDAIIVDCSSGACSCAATLGSQAGAEGGTGTTGATGQSGAGGAGIGTLDSSTWVVTPDMQGQVGLLGSAGGGGGGGGSGGSCLVAPSEAVDVSAGGAGGGGGAGGCGGEGGTGGHGGGASIGLLLFHSHVTVETGSRIATHGGGIGGTGGRGGVGGDGGVGGPGVTGSVFASKLVDGGADLGTHGGSGGAGGPGGTGGQGGRGGGGAGGPSVGIWCAPDSQVTLGGGVIIDAGPGGLGGESTSQRGSSGISERSFSCTPIP